MLHRRRYLQEEGWCDDLIVSLLPLETFFKETSPFTMKEINSPIRKFFRMLSLNRTISLRFLVMTLLKVDCILSTGALG